MAIPLSCTTIPFAPTCVPSQSKIVFPISFSTQKRPSSLQGHAKQSAMLSHHIKDPKSSFQSSSLIDLNNGNKGENEITGEDASERVLAECWTEIHGKDDWAGMLDPLDPILRSELIRYGEMAQACYDAFDFDSYSINCGSCRYPKSRFFESLGMESHGYSVTRYLFATSSISRPKFFKKSLWPQVWSEKANWIGYIAVSDDKTSQRLGRRDINIAWRGTVTQLEWLHDLMDILQPVNSDKIPCPDPSVKVESGFVSLYTDKDADCPYCNLSLREQILAEVSRLMEKYHGEELSITVTGHSLGAALAVLSAFDIAETGLHIKQDGSSVPLCVFSFSGPRVGNTPFKERLENTLGVKVLRVYNVNDVVPKAPGFLVNEHVPPALGRLVEAFPWSYSHVGMELQLDHRNSPFLKDTIDKACAHNLEALMHLIDGYQGKGGHFSLAYERDIALVNKGCNFLKDQYQIPPTWRQYENKGMVRTKDGRWIQPERPLIEELHDDIHHHLRQLGLADAK